MEDGEYDPRKCTTAVKLRQASTSPPSTIISTGNKARNGKGNHKSKFLTDINIKRDVTPAHEVKRRQLERKNRKEEAMEKDITNENSSEGAPARDDLFADNNEGI